MPISDDGLRILLISAAEETRDQVEAALASGMGAYRLYWVSQPDLALSRAEELMPQVALVDDVLAGTRLPALIQDLGEHVPGAVILALVSSDSMGLANQAVLAGARGFCDQARGAGGTQPERARDPGAAAFWGRGRLGRASGRPRHGVLRPQGRHRPHHTGDQHRH